MVVRRREQDAITVNAVALGEHCLDLLGHAFLELEDIGIKEKHFTFALLEEDGVGEDVVMDARRRFKTVGKIAVANQVDVALWGDFAARVSNVHARSPSVSRRIQGGNDDFDEALMGSGGKTGVHGLIGDLFVRVGSR